MPDALIPVILALPFVAAVAPWAVRRRDAGAALLATAAPVTLAIALLATLGPEAVGGQVLRAEWAWLPSLGVSLAFRVDALSWLFGMMVLVIGVLVQLYARYYLGHENLQRLYALLGLFMGAMLALVLAGDLLVLVVAWEATSLVSFLLIGFKTTDPEARLGARTALAVTGMGGLALLGGVLLIGRIAGGFSLDTVLAAGDAVRAHPHYRPALLLVLLGVFTKSAQFPFHFWLPRAMAAPTPISAYLHSATMVKAGVFLLARLFPVLGGTPEWTWIVSSVGMVTMLVGAYTALWEHDLKGLLAYSTISHLGLITLLFGFGSDTAVVAAIFHTINHATFKASLFMAAGMIDVEARTRDMRILHGLWRYMPLTGLLSVVAVGAMAGVPLVNGFLSKEMFFAEALSAQAIGLRWIEPAAAVAAGALGVAYSLRFILEVFFGDADEPMPRVPTEPPLLMRFPAALLASACLAVGIVPAWFVEPFLSRAAAVVLGAQPPAVSLSLWHGVNLPLLMTIVAFGAGVLLFRARHRLHAWHDRLPTLEGLRVLDAALFAATRSARVATRWYERATLSAHLGWLLVAAALAVVITFREGSLPSVGGVSVPSPVAADAPAIAVWLLLVAAVAATVAARRRPLPAILAVSAVGLCVALAFVHLGAPDLALTQLLVELATLLLLLLAARALPDDPARAEAPRAPATARAAAHRQHTVWRRWRDPLLAAGAGGGAAVAAWLLLVPRPEAPLAGYLRDASVPLGGGTNVVNVILVDFRSFDTYAEVAVLGVAALGVVMALAGIATPRPPSSAPTGGWAERHPAMLTAAARLALPLALLLAVFLLLRGHDLPGGGFAAGVLAAVALYLQRVAHGRRWADARRRVPAPALIASGVLVTTLTGAASVVAGRPFFTSYYEKLSVPLLGKVPVSSALVFDIGVMLAVVGAILLVLERLGAVDAEGGPDSATSTTAGTAVEPVVPS